MNLPDDPHGEDRTPWEEMLSSMLGPEVAAEAISSNSALSCWIEIALEHNRAVTGGC